MLRSVRLGCMLALGCTLALESCGVRMLDRWDGRPVVRREVPAPADLLWTRLRRRAAELGLLIAEIRTEDRVIEFDWVTAPGDGRLYLRCRESGPIGSASLKPRVSVEPVPAGSVLVIESRVRATTPAACESRGQLEGWLLERLEPAIDAAVGAAESPDGGR